MNAKKRLLSFALVFAMMASLLPTAAFAAEAAPEGAEAGLLTDAAVTGSESLKDTVTDDTATDNTVTDNTVTDNTAADNTAADNTVTDKTAIAGEESLEDTPATVADVTQADVYVGSTGSDETGDGTEKAPVATLAKAYTMASDGGTIHVLSDLAVENNALTVDGKTLTLVGEAEAAPVVKRTTGDSNPLVTVTSGALTVKNLALSGAGKETNQTKSLVSIETAGALTLGDGASIQDAGMAQGNTAWGQVVVSGSLTMEDGSAIRNLTAASGCVRIDLAEASFTMNGGEITNCDSHMRNEGNAVYIAVGSLFTMNGGTISGCGQKGTDAAGTVYLHSGSNQNRFVMTGGKITGNKATSGGGVYMQKGTVTLSGTPVIQDNTLKDGTTPSNVYLDANQTVTVGAGGLEKGAQIGVYTATAPTDKADVQIATGAANAATAGRYFFSDNAAAAGILYCDGTNDWLNGKKLEPASAGHKHAAQGLFLSVKGATQADVYVGSSGNDETGDGTEKTPVATLTKAYTMVSDGGTIHVLDDLTADAAITLDIYKAATIRGEEGAKKITRGKSLTEPTTGTTTGTTTEPTTGTMCKMSAGEVTLRDIVFDGGAVWTGADDSVLGRGVTNTELSGKGRLVEVSGDASLTLDTGAVLQNNHRTGAAQTGNETPTGSAVLLTGASSLTIQGGTIKDNRLDDTYGDGAAVSAWGSDTKITMKGGTISGNSAERYGSAVRLEQSAMTMSGGEIRNNKATGTGGASAVSVMNNAARFVMTGGKICDNASTVNGGGVYAYSTKDPAAVTISGGEISGNTAPLGGGVFLEGSTVTLSGAPNITGNKTAAGAPSNVYLAAGQTVTVGAGGLKEGAQIGVYTATAPSAGTDVKIATGANDTDVPYFTSDNAADAGVIFKDSALWLSVTAAKIDAPKITLGDVDVTGKGTLEEKLTAPITIENYDVTGGETYYYSVNGGEKQEITSASFSVAELKYGDNVQVWIERNGAVGGKATAKILDTALCNGGFETIATPYGADLQTGKSIYAWHTTADGGNIEVYPHSIYGLSAIEGQYCAELNAYVPSSLYQEIKTTPAEKFAWGLNHSGRMGTDVMAMIIGPASADGSYGTANQKGDKDFFQKLVAGMTDKAPGKHEGVPAENGEKYTVWIFSDAKALWGAYDGEYEIPADQTATVFAFTSVSSVGGDSTGNVLDGVFFENKPLEVTGGITKTGRGKITVKAEVGGVYTICKSDGTPYTKAELDAMGIVAKNAQGAVVSPSDAGEYTGADDTWTYSVPAGSRYQVWVNYTSTGTKRGQNVVIPAVGGNLTGGVAGEDGNKTATITIDPADPGLKYALLNPDGSVAKDWTAGGEDKVEFTGLEPGKKYQVVAVPVSDTETGAGDKKDEGVTATTPGDGLKPVDPATAIRSEDDDKDGKHKGSDKISIKPVDEGLDYGVYDPVTGNTLWLSGKDTKEDGGTDDDALEFHPLVRDRDYEIVTRTPGEKDKDGNLTTEPSLPGPGVTVPVTTVKAGTTDEGKSAIIVNPTDKALKYALADEDGNVVAPLSGDTDGWLTGTGGALVFAPTEVGKTYHVIATPVKPDDPEQPGVPSTDEGKYPKTTAGDDPKGTPKPSTVGPPAVTSPDVTEGQLGGKVITADPDKGKTVITIQPSNPGLKYAIYDPDGNKVGEWQTGTGAGGAALEFKPLDPGKEYTVKTSPVDKNPETPSTGTGVKTPDVVTDPTTGAVTPKVTPLDPDGVDRAHITAGPDAGKDKITVTDPGAGFEVAVIDPATGTVVAPVEGSASGWLTGGNGDLVFQPVDRNKRYEVVVRPTGDGGSLVAPVRPGVTVSVIRRGSSDDKTSAGVKAPKHPGGSVTTSPTSPKKGEDFIITVTPDEGYVLDKLTVTDPKGGKLTVTPIGDGKYRVTMPDPAVALTVDATFKKLSGDPHNNGVAELLNVDDHIAYISGRAGGKFAPADNMTRAEVAQMFYNLLKDKNTNLGSKASFSDVDASAWYAKAVGTLANIGIVEGVGGGGFAPERAITRAEFVAIAARFAQTATGGDTFSDVPATHWAYAEITTATAYGWISGYGDGSFKPGANIARSEAVKIVNTMLSRSADKAAVDASKTLVTFSDVAKTNWAYYPIMEAANAHDFERKDGAEVWSK